MLNEELISRRQVYIAKSWIKSSKVVIQNETLAIKTHNANKSNSYWRVYSNESEQNNDVTAATVDANWEQKKRLEKADITLTHHEKLEGLTIETKQLTAHCERSDNCASRVYKIYSNSQASLKIVNAMISTTDQLRLRRIQNACKTIREKKTQLKLHWIFDHKEIKDNEKADRVINEAHKYPLMSQLTCESVVRAALIQKRARTKWQRKWKKDTNEVHYRTLTSTITHRHMRLHDERTKSYNALLTQLRTSKINFNQFSSERRVSEVITGICDCEQNRMTVKHVLLTYSTWRQKRLEMQRKTNNITDIRKLLDSVAGATATIRIILFTDLLTQFQAIFPLRILKLIKSSHEGFSSITNKENSM